MKHSLFIIILLFTSCSMNRMIREEKEEILSKIPDSEPEIVTEERIQSLPEPVKKWLKTSGIVGEREITHGYIRQSAKMKMKPEQKEWFKAQAEHIFTVQEPAFVWTVSMKMNPLISIRGRDKFIDGKGEMRIRMNSLINVVNEKGEKLDMGTLQRYLGEIVWYPSAALSPYITWEPIDEYSAKATMNYKGTIGSGSFFFNENGDFIKFSAMRFKDNDAHAEQFEWIITVRDHAVMDSVKIPVVMDAAWKLETGEWTWMKLTIEEVRFNKKM
jgi:hypothetical protein